MNVSEELRSSEERILQLVSFNLGSEEFAVDILKIQEINRMTEITKVPRSPEFVDGVINLRGKVIPVIDLRKRFGLPEQEHGKNTRIVVMDIQRKIVGFVVDSVSEVLRISSATVEATPPMVSGIDSEYIRGVGKLDDRLLILLDVNKMLSSGEVEMLDGPSVEEDIATSKAVTTDTAKLGNEKVTEYRGMAGMVEVNRDIEKAIDEMSSKVELTREDLQKLVSHVKGILEGNFMDEDLELYGDLGELAKFINETKKSLLQFDAAEITDKDLPEASDQLTSIVEATEEATNKILTDTEELLEAQGRIAKVVDAVKAIKVNKNTKGSESRDFAVTELKEISDLANAKLMDIMSACNFQDLTGQRIQKIIQLVKRIESKLMMIILSFNIKLQEKADSVDESKINKEKEMLAKLEQEELKGPQKKGEGVNQSDVDDLLNDLFG
ncbi:MAG: protein phosphatase CheZ [Proteobacteria bacterium]|nr:protein phosphatase CheZ [Pseudomonadota bacterium]